MTDVDEQGRPQPPLAGDEAETLLGFLDFQRATFAWKCSGLDSVALQTPIAASSMTLGGMMKHLAFVENYWCAKSLPGRDATPPWPDTDGQATPDWGWDSAAEDSPAQLLEFWQRTVAQSRALVTQALDERGLGAPVLRPWADGRMPNLRWILLHLIEEYARHNGHADLLRESIDGLTGE